MSVYEPYTLINEPKKMTEILLLVTTWMDLECIRLNEISYTKKGKYCIISHICGL